MALIDFLEKDVKRLREARDKEENIALKNKLSKHKSRIQEKKTALANVTSAGKCYLCQGDHLIYHCGKPCSNNRRATQGGLLT